MDTKKVDGYASFLGGMDSSRSPSLLSQNQYCYSVNCKIPKNAEGISSRDGWRYIDIKFDHISEKEIFESGNPQGSGYYFDGKHVIMLFVISGWVFEVKKEKSRYISKIINKNLQNDPLVKRAFVIKIPFGAIINDGINAAIFTDGKITRRTNPRRNEIGAGLMGIYVQNRLWYVKPDRRNIWASTIKQPLSTEEAYLANIFGAVVPEDDKFITAIGKQGTLGRDAAGGNLAFSTPSDFYSIDVRGDRTLWGKTSGSGFVDNSLPGLGAISPYSFESFNSNVFYRNPQLGLVSLNNGSSEFFKQDVFTKHSIEASLFFDNDTELFLDRCYTKAYKKSLYTTVGPKCNEDGFVYWNGIIVKTPDPNYGHTQQTNKDIIESVYTGLRPWSILTTEDIYASQNFCCLSYDYDCVNRLYILDESLSYDINKDHKRVDIESQILTRSFNFKSDVTHKVGVNQFYYLDEIKSDVNVKILTRTSERGSFEKQWNFKHKSNKPKGFNCSNVYEDRQNVGVSNDPIKGNSLKEYLNRQDLFIINGPFNLRRWIRTVDMVPSKIYIPSDSSEDKKKDISNKNIPIYSYQISK